MPELKKLRFKTISNSGRIDGMSNQCMFISIYHYLKYVANIEHVTVREIREVGGLDSDTENIMYDYDDPRYANCLDKICSNYSIQIKIYCVNKEPNNHRWLGNCYCKFGSKNDQKVRIASFGYHFELINSIGTTEFFKNDIINNTINDKSQKIITNSSHDCDKSIPDIKQSTSDSSKQSSSNSPEQSTSDSSKQSSSDMIIEALVINSVELTKDVDVVRENISKLILEINELEKRFVEKKVMYKNTSDSDLKKKIKTEIEVIKNLGEVKKQLILNYKFELDKLKNMINKNMNETHMLEISN